VGYVGEMSDATFLPLNPNRLTEPLPPSPDAVTWGAMSEAERDDYMIETNELLERTHELMCEGRPHEVARSRIGSVLREHFRRTGRRVYLATNLAVHYPGQRPFDPDLIAVLDVEDPYLDDVRKAWMVLVEGRGLDLVIEITHYGDRRKDLVKNVEFYARLGIREYFVYDRLKERLLGYRLPSALAGVYEPIPSRGGQLWSEVLDLGLALMGGTVRFLHEDGAEVPEIAELLTRANTLLDEAGRRAEAAEAAHQEELRRAEAAEARVAELEALLAEARRRA